MIKKLLFIVFLMLSAFSEKVVAQCSITGTSVSASTLNNTGICTTFLGCTTVYVGNGSAATTLTLNEGLNFTCLGAINFVITANATIVFGTSANDKLTLGEGSSITVIAGGNLSGGNNCTSSDRIVIGTNLVSTCDGNAGTDLSFPDIISLGGTGNATSNSPVCASAGNTINLSATPPPNGGPYTYSWSGPNNFSSTSQNPIITNPTVSGAGLYSVSMTSTTLGTNRTVLAQTTVVVNSGTGPPAPTIGLITQPTCSVFTGSVVLNGLPASGTWTLTRNPGAIKTTGTGTSKTIAGLTSGTYNFTISNGTCTSEASSNVVINATTNTWNVVSGVGSWTNASTSSQAIIFNGNYSSTTDLKACSCTVNSGAIKINSGNNLILEGKLTVNAPGTLTFEDSASLVQTTAFTGLNSGNIIYKRNISSALTTDYTYWSSPVASQTLNLSPYYVSGMFYSFNNSTEAWIPATISTPMAVGQGYIARGPVTTLPPGFYNATFTGEPNNGNQTITVAGGAKSILLGNPYPSAIDADTFILANSSAIDGTLYFWTHNTPIAIGTPNPGSGVWAYSGNDYASYTLSGGTGTAGNFNDTNGNGTMDPGEEVVSNKPTGEIAAGQGFFTTSSSAGGTVNFTNVMRLGNPNDNSNFYKTKNAKIKTTAKLEKHRVWLNLTNKEGAFKQTLVGYITGATNNWDSLFDGLSFDGNDFLDFYSINQEKNLTIQGRALPFDENDEIPLGYRIAVEGTFSISIDETDGMLANQDIFIEDKLTNTVFDLKSGKYTFNTTAGTFDDRFVLRYTNKTLGKEEVELNDGIIALYSNNYKTLIIRNNVNDATVNAVELFNLLGQNITNWEVDDSEQINIQIPIKNTSSGIYIVKIKTTKGEFSKKIIIK